MTDSSIDIAPGAAPVRPPASAGTGAPPGPTRVHNAATVAEARRLVETTRLSLHEIAFRISVAPTTLSAWRRRFGWRRPDGAPEPPLFTAGEDLTAEARARPKRMIERLYRVFSRQLSDVETRGREDGAAADEKDARMLGTLARTLGTLMALDRDDGATADEPEPVDPHEIRAKLAKRLLAMGEGGQAP